MLKTMYDKIYLDCMYKQSVLSKSLRHLEQRVYILFEDYLSEMRQFKKNAPGH